MIVHVRTHPLTEGGFFFPGDEYRRPQWYSLTWFHQFHPLRAPQPEQLLLDPRRAKILWSTLGSLIHGKKEKYIILVEYKDRAQMGTALTLKSDINGSTISMTPSSGIVLART